MNETLASFVLSRLGDHAGGLAVMLGLVVALGVFEWLFPAEQGQTWQGRIQNVGFMSVFQLAGGVLVSLIAYQVLPYLLLQAEPIPSRSPLQLAATIVLYMFVSDSIFYWYHRAQHAVPWLWAIHELHHSDRELNATSSLRTYLFDRPLQFMAITLPVTALAARVPALHSLSLSARESEGLYLVSLSWLFFAHANLRLELGRWSWMATAPQVHRLHHSVEPDHAGTNFAQFFPLLDVAFGTYRAPRAAEFPKTGTSGASSAAALTHALTRPFRIGPARGIANGRRTGETPGESVTSQGRAAVTADRAHS